MDGFNLIDGVFDGYERAMSNQSSPARVPLLIGTTRDETHLTGMIYSAVDSIFNLSDFFLSKSGFENLLRFIFKDRFKKVSFTWTARFFYSPINVM